MNLLIGFLLFVLIVNALLLIFIVLLQRPRSEGLGTAFAGGMVERVAGAQATDVLGKITTWMGGSFFFLTVLLSFLYAHQSQKQTKISKQLRGAPVPVAVASPSPSPSPSLAPLVPVPGGSPAVVVATPTPEASPIASPLPSVLPALSPAPLVAPMVPTPAATVAPTPA